MSKIDKSGTYHLSVYDDEISQYLQCRVYDFLINSEYQVNFYDPSHTKWYPKDDRWVTERNWPSQPRLPLAWDEYSLKDRAPVIYELWTEISHVLGHQYEIDGVPESMQYMTGISPLSGIDKSDGTPGKPNSGWRVYGSGNERELRGRTKSIHRDCPYLDKDGYFNLVYFANQEWFPQYYGETLFHSNDPTGDFTGRFEPDQPRNFPIGDPEAVVTPKSRRFMLYDARYMHQIKPAAHYAPNILGIVFRLRRK